MFLNIIFYIANVSYGASVNKGFNLKMTTTVSVQQWKIIDKLIHVNYEVAEAAVVDFVLRLT